MKKRVTPEGGDIFYRCEYCDNSNKKSDLKQIECENGHKHLICKDCLDWNYDFICVKEM